MTGIAQHFWFVVNTIFSNLCSIYFSFHKLTYNAIEYKYIIKFPFDISLLCSKELGNFKSD